MVVVYPCVPNRYKHQTRELETWRKPLVKLMKGDRKSSQEGQYFQRAFRFRSSARQTVARVELERHKRLNWETLVVSSTRIGLGAQGFGWWEPRPTGKCDVQLNFRLTGTTWSENATFELHSESLTRFASLLSTFLLLHFHRYFIHALMVFPEPNLRYIHIYNFKSPSYIYEISTLYYVYSYFNFTISHNQIITLTIKTALTWVSVIWESYWYFL